MEQRDRGSVVTPAPRPAPVLLVGALVSVVVLMAALAGPWQIRHRFVLQLDRNFRPPPHTARADPSPVATHKGTPITEEPWLLLVAFAVVGFVVVLALAFLLRWLLQKRREQRALREFDAADPGGALEGDAADVATRAMRAGAQSAARALEDEGPPGDAVIAAWVALEASADKSGIHRDRAQTATEFTLEVLGSTPADPQAAQELLDLYLAARFSEHRITQRDVQHARESLATIAEGLRS